MSVKSILKVVLPKKIIDISSTLRMKVERFIICYLPNNRIFAKLYYCFYSNSFAREHRAVIAGKKFYYLNNGVGGVSSALLRRNTHRLEKGLIMQPRRKIFAEGFIIDTVECYSQCLNENTVCPEELKWCYDVLTHYFSIIGSSSIIDSAKEKFAQLEDKINENNVSNSSLPYSYNKRTTSDVSSEQLHNLFRQRRSVRWYERKEVDLALIKKAVDMAAQAPSACNRQPFKFHTITNSERAAEIASIPMGTKGFAHNIPALIVIVGDLSAYPNERDRHVIYIDGGLVAMQLMLAFESLGLSTCPINWPDMEAYEKKMEQQLNLAKYERPIMLMAVGYGEPTGQIPFSQKKNNKLLIKEVK